MGGGEENVGGGEEDVGGEEVGLRRGNPNPTVVDTWEEWEVEEEGGQEAENVEEEGGTFGVCILIFCVFRFLVHVFISVFHLINLVYLFCVFVIVVFVFN